MEHCFGNLALFGENPGGEIPGIVIIRIDAQGVAQGNLGVIGFAAHSPEFRRAFVISPASVGSRSIAFRILSSASDMRPTVESRIP